MSVNRGLIKLIVIAVLLSQTLPAQSNQTIDLSYPFNAKTIYWPTEKGFSLEKFFSGITPRGYFYAAYHFCAPEHGGTHIDAPSHFSQHGHTVEQIPVAQLFGNAVVIHLEKKVAKNRDYAIQIQDIKEFEQQYRALTPRDIVLFYTGWGQYWANKEHYLGSDKFGDTQHLHFPGLSNEAATYLVSKKIKGVGLDTPSLDPGVSLDFKAHQTILSANIFGLENLANLNLLPPIGSKLIVAPMKIEGGSGAPTRVFGVIAAKFRKN